MLPLPVPALGTHTSPPLPSLSTWTCSDHLLGLPSGHGPRSFLHNFTPMPPCRYSSVTLHSPQDKDRAPYPGIQGLSSCPAATGIVNAMCVLAWALGWPDVWSDIILGVSVRVFRMRLAFKSVEGAKQTALPKVGGPHPISRLEQKADPPLGKREFFLPDRS